MSDSVTLTRKRRPRKPHVTSHTHKPTLTSTLVDYLAHGLTMEDNMIIERLMDRMYAARTLDERALVVWYIMEFCPAFDDDIAWTLRLYGLTDKEHRDLMASILRYYCIVQSVATDLQLPLLKLAISPKRAVAYITTQLNKKHK